jgi:hypothetical protein
MGVYRVQGTIKEEFVTNVIQVEMQNYHLYIIHHATKATNSTPFYRTKHDIVNNYMV